MISHISNSLEYYIIEINNNYGLDTKALATILNAPSVNKCQYLKCY